MCVKHKVIITNVKFDIYIYIFRKQPFIYACLIKKNGTLVVYYLLRVFRKYENTRKKIINNECAILFNKTCIHVYI